MPRLVRDAMTLNPRTLQPTASVVQAACVMEEEDVGALPVVQHDQVLVGIVTDRDIALGVVAAGRDPKTTAVGEILTAGPMAAEPEEPLDQALEQIVFSGVCPLPVVEDDRVVGVVDEDAQ